MKVILLQDVPKVGKAGDVLEVKEGFGRNFLLRRGLAEIPSSKTVHRVLAQKEAKKSAQSAEKLALKDQVKSLQGKKIKIAAKVNAQGHLYQAVREKDIAKKLNLAPGLVNDVNIKSVGIFEIKIGYANVHSTIVLEITPEK